jgi:hypothetical protein
MRKHVKIYMKHFGYGEQDFIPSEVSGARATDIHHIEPKGMGGSKTKDYIENLIALTREEHERAHADREFNAYIKELHLSRIKKGSD